MQMRSRLMSGQWFSHLPVSFQDSLLAAARERRLTAGQRLFQRGDAPCGLYAVLDGAVRIGAVSEQGKEALLSLVEAPHWFGEICLFDGQPRTHDAYAVGPCTLLNIPQAVLLKLLDEQPVYWRHLALLMIAEGYGELDAPRRVLQLPQEQLASMLSLSRQTTNQILKDLQGQGIIGLGYGEIEILDAARLRALATI